MSLDVNLSEPDEFNCNELHSSIDEVAKLKGLDDFVYHVDFISGKGEHFTSNVFKILIKDAQSDIKHSFMVKTLINTERQDLFHELHKREVKVYETVLKKYEEIQKVINVEKRVVFPKCEFTKIEPSKEVIILEDMNAKGYETESKLANLNYPQASAAIKALAKFHALSLIYKIQDPSFATVKSEFQDIIFSERFLSNRNKLRSYFQDSYGMSLDLVEDLEAKSKLVKVQSRLLELLNMYTKSGKNNVLCHGDYWINNIMFKHEENEEAKVCFIDFQVMRYSSPFTDIYYLFLFTDSTFRSTYFDALMNDYYDSLKSFLNVYNIDVNSVYTKEDFDTDCKNFLPFGLLVSMIDLRIVTTPGLDRESKESDIEPETSNSEVLDNKQSSIEPDTSESSDTEVLGESIFKKRVNDVVNEYVENGVLDRLIDELNSL